MIKRTIAKPLSFIKSLVTKRHRAKLYVRGLENTVIRLHRDIELLKRQ